MEFEEWANVTTSMVSMFIKQSHIISLKIKQSNIISLRGEKIPTLSA